ncbi:MAG: aspartate aminotransferase family protein, partial [Pseudomonadota bacterium]
MAEDASAATPEALMGVYARAPIEVAKGEGAWLEDVEGARYLDFTSGIAVNALGHAHPALVAALTAQAQTLWHTSNLFRVPGQERLAARLCAETFADRVFFTNSGAEAIECCIKTARRFHAHAGRPERWRILAFEGAFHGRTLAAIAAAGAPKLTEGFGPMPGGFDQIPFADHDAIDAAVGPETAAILIEPVQGEGGVRVVPPQCLKGLRDLCDRHGVLLIYDEVQSGMGRTGKLFAHEWAGAAPDLMAAAKGIGGGFPLGACLATEAAAAGMTPGAHGTTYGGNPLAMAVANAVLDVMAEPGFFEHVSRLSGRLGQGLAGLVAAHPGVFTAVRGEGLLLGIVCAAPNADVIAAARAEGLLVATRARRCRPRA